MLDDTLSLSYTVTTPLSQHGCTILFCVYLGLVDVHVSFLMCLTLIMDEDARTSQIVAYPLLCLLIFARVSLLTFVIEYEHTCVLALHIAVLVCYEALCIVERICTTFSADVFDSFFICLYIYTHISRHVV